MSIRPYLCAALLTACLGVSPLRSQELLQPRHVFDAGGGSGTGDQLRIRQTFGQPFVQKGSGPTLTLGGGFLTPPGEAPPVIVTMFSIVSAGWNLVSVPLDVDDFRKSAVYPSAASNAFGYENGYFVKDTLAPGVGYWVKFSSTERLLMSGRPRTGDTVEISAGWNLVGALSAAVGVDALGAAPPGQSISNFFGFEEGYQTADSLRPGKGYWVKASLDGWLVLGSVPGAVPAADRVRIVPDGELPPAPPPDAAGPDRDPLPVAYALRQNYPNPFNPGTEIRYDLPEAAEVRLSLFNILGEEVARIVDAREAAGFKSVRFDASHLPSGVYFCRLTAGAYVAVNKMMVVR